MIAYGSLLFLVTTLSFLYKITKNKFFILMIYLFACFFAGFRYEVGVDYNSYIRAYNDILSGFNSGYFEPGNVFLIQFIDKIGGTAQLYLLTIAVATNILIYLFVIKYSKNYIVSTYFYIFVSLFYFASFNAVRQFLAIAIFLYAIRFIVERKLLSYIITIFIGALFHISIIVLLPLYFFVGKKYSLYQYLVYGSIILVSISSLLTFVIKLFDKGNYLDFSNTTSSQVMIYVFIIIVIYLLVIIKDKNKEVNVFKNLIFISLLLFILEIVNSDMSMILIRLNSYFLFALIPLVSYLAVYNIYKIKINNFIYIMPLLLVSYLYFFNTIINKGVAYNLTPYQMNFKIFKDL